MLVITKRPGYRFAHPHPHAARNSYKFGSKSSSDKTVLKDETAAAETFNSPAIRYLIKQSRTRLLTADGREKQYSITYRR